MPTGLYLPASIRREVLHRREQFRADVLSSIVLDDSDPFLREFTLKLQAFDRGCCSCARARRSCPACR
jgi:hypothetical protein